MPRVRVHQHVNPLSPYYTTPPEPIDLAQVFADPSLPMHLDIGCARGRFILKMAETQPQWNFLGVEIREPLVTEANEIAAEKKMTNLYYEFCNAMIWLDRLLADLPDGLLQMVTIQFPDPWFKKRHAKRRMVHAELVETVVNKLANGGRIFVQTDIESLAEEMSELFCAERRLKESVVNDNPFPVKTEREKAVENKELPVYRMMFTKSAS
ncbi:MAG: tRNA (guanosine(46)-N7)-methyltransferase TrmB [Pyrinomonadaceae bacterium]